MLSSSSFALGRLSLRSLSGIKCNPARSFAVSHPASSLPSIPGASVNHVAIAVADLPRAMDMYRTTLGARVSEPEAQTAHGVTTVFVELANTKIELLEPLGDKSPILKFLEKNPSGGIHHVCLDVNDIEAAVELMRNNGVRTLTEGTKIGAHGKPVIFLHPKDCGGVLLELQQR